MMLSIKCGTKMTQGKVLKVENNSEKRCSMPAVNEGLFHFIALHYCQGDFVLDLAA